MSGAAAIFLTTLLARAYEALFGRTSFTSPCLSVAPLFGNVPRGPAWIIRSVYVQNLAGKALGSLGDDFVIVQWTAEVGDHWIAPLHVHRGDDEAWYVLSGTLGFRLGDDEIEASPGSAVFARRAIPTRSGTPGKARLSTSS